MTPGFSKVLINELIIPSRDENFFPMQFDFNVMAIAAGMIRTEEQWHQLLGSVGLKIVRIWTEDPNSESLIEAMLTWIDTTISRRWSCGHYRLTFLMSLFCPAFACFSSLKNISSLPSTFGSISARYCVTLIIIASRFEQIVSLKPSFLDNLKKEAPKCRMSLEQKVPP